MYTRTHIDSHAFRRCLSLSFSVSTVHVVNMDPAAEHFEYPVAIDIRDLISLSDVIEELNYGPNGGLVYCMEYLMDNFSWLADQINDYGDDYLIFDLPGQIELYTHLPVMQKFVHFLQTQCSYTLCAIYLLDSLFITDSSRFISGTMMCLSAMVQLELPHLNILTKCDLITNKKQLERFLDPDMEGILQELGAPRITGGGGGGRRKVKGSSNDEDVTSASAASSTPAMPIKYQHLNRAISTLIEQYSMVNFFPLDITDEECVSLCIQHIDRATGYGEDLEPKEPKDQEHEIGLEAIQE